MENTPTPMTADAVLDREFLEMRAKILELAASFDRLDRGEGGINDDRRMELIREALKLLEDPNAGRAEKIQLLFSREYSGSWRNEFGI
ncbi:hypothetical protein OAF56_01470 [Pirellulaceae bacterium]|jgi:hypothetical protein|nr:hypothetical protein [Pirellulaceae bacterium]